MTAPIQLFDHESFTYTYLLVDPVTGAAALIDPVDTRAERDLDVIKQSNARLELLLETHAHADHVTSAGRLRELTGAKAGAPIGCGIAPADIQLFDGDQVRFGNEVVRVIHTPGHTAGSVSYLWRNNVFTGDALLIGGCGRTDFQSGDAGALYDSITGKLFTLPDETVVFPAHDYNGRNSSTIGIEKIHNTRLVGKSREEFIQLMAALSLPPPRLMDVAVPANQRLGLPHGG
jgi:sulfur dioxygenase